jgi:hypothetical protein
LVVVVADSKLSLGILPAPVASVFDLGNAGAMADGGGVDG